MVPDEDGKASESDILKSESISSKDKMQDLRWC